MAATMSKAEVDTSKFLESEKYQATRKWLESQELQGEEVEEDLESVAESSIIESSVGDSATETETDEDGTVAKTTLGTQSDSNQSAAIELKDLLNAINSVQTVGNVKIENSTGVHIGNVTNINGNIQIIHTEVRRKKRSKSKSNLKDDSSDSSQTRSFPPANNDREERVSSDAFLNKINITIPKELCVILPRHTWLAQQPMEEYDYIPEPVKYVIISHTATESSEKQAVNIRLIRDIQCFHIESREWNDIAYNFLIGCDGNAYEGRGWGVVGAHTRGYNNCSIGISFIGCFMRTLPTEAALNACKNLLKRGVEKGHLAADYKLICHCQCRATESPGRKLFEEIQKWDHFYNFSAE